jgi:hypothetical protein
MNDADTIRERVQTAAAKSAAVGGALTVVHAGFISQRGEWENALRMVSRLASLTFDSDTDSLSAVGDGWNVTVQF